MEIKPLAVILLASLCRGDVVGRRNLRDDGITRRRLMGDTVLRFESCMEDNLTPEQCESVIKNHESAFDELKVRIQTPRTADRLDSSYFLVEVPTNIHGTMACDRNEGRTYYPKSWHKGEDDALDVEDIDCHGKDAAQCCDAIKDYGKNVLGPDQNGNYLQCFVHQEHMIPLLNEENAVLYHDYETNTNECDKVTMSKLEVDAADEITRGKIRGITGDVEYLITEGANALIACDTIRDLRTHLYNSARAIAKVQSYMHVLFEDHVCVEQSNKLSFRQPQDFVSKLETMHGYLLRDMPSSSDTVVTIYTDRNGNIRTTPTLGGARGHNLLVEDIMPLPPPDFNPTPDVNLDALRETAQNIALGRHATNSQPYLYGPSSGPRPQERYAANNAVDGDTDTRSWLSAASQSTSDGCNPSWTVWFEQAAYVFEIRIWGRVLPSRYEALADFRVQLLDEDENVVATLDHDGEVDEDATLPTSLDFNGAIGKAVRILRTDCNIPIRLAEVHVMGAHVSGEIDVLRGLSTNVALGGRATQRPNPSSSYQHPVEPWRDGSARWAVDGFTSGRTHTNLALTAVNVNNFWKVNLHDSPHKVFEVTVWNREDEYAENLHDFEVILWNGSQVAYSYRHIAVAGTKTVFDFGGAIGTDVEIFLFSPKSPRDKEENFLSLAEVEVFGVPVSANGVVGSILSTGRNTVQSDSYVDFGGNPIHRYIASNAANGIKVGDGLMVAKTRTPSTICKPWWRVDLERPSHITLVTVWGNNPTPSTILANFHVKVLDADGNTVSSKFFNGPVDANEVGFDFGAVVGSSVIVERTDCGISLELIEVDVVGLHLPPTEEEVDARAQMSNVAVNKPATQKSTADGMVAEGAVDGGLTSGLTKTEDSFNNWWRVDLEDSYEIYEIVVWNWFQTELRDFLVTVQGADGEAVFEYLVTGEAERMTKLDFNGVVGQSVQISNVDHPISGTPAPRRLQLMEVQVFGNQMSNQVISR